MFRKATNKKKNTFQEEILKDELYRCFHPIPLIQEVQFIVYSVCQSETHERTFKCFRVLIAYEKGLLVLWDVSEDHAIAVRGYGDLHMKGKVTGAHRDSGEDQIDNVDENEEEREICSLCWASKGGSTVAVGYITGDILLWDMTTRSSRQGKQSDVSSNVVKLQLASGSRRLPVIVLHWSAGSAIDTSKGGHLFVYGGDDMGSEEVLTVCALFHCHVFCCCFFPVIFLACTRAIDALQGKLKCSCFTPLPACKNQFLTHMNSNLGHLYVMCLV